jgi:hypothetical protein
MVLAGLTPPEWKISILDENLGVPDYKAMPRPDLVGITTFISQGGFFTFKINLKKAILSWLENRLTTKWNEKLSDLKKKSWNTFAKQKNSTRNGR